MGFLGETNIISNLYYQNDVSHAYVNQIHLEVIMMTLEQQLKYYITNLFKLPKDEKWECESIEEVADDILPEQYVRLSPLSNKILQTYTYYSDTLHESNIYPFILYYQKQLIAIGYIDENHDMDFLYLHNTIMPLLDQRYLLTGGQ